MKRHKISKKLQRDNRGSGLIMVLIVIAFLGILSGILMFASYGGYKMRLVDKQNKDNFYTVETVLDEINVGLQNEVSEALALAYQDVMQNYSLYETPAKRSQKMYDLYYNAIQQRLAKDPLHLNEGSVANLISYLSDASKGDGAGTRGSFGTYGAIVESSNVTDPDTYEIVNEANKGIVLKGIEVTYVNQRGIVAIISTDIRIGMPRLNFSESSAFPDLQHYCLITGDTLSVENTEAGSSALVKGNVYAGQMVFEKSAGIVGSNITFEPSADAAGDEPGLVVCKDGIQVKEGTLTTTNTELWTSGIVLDSAKAVLDGQTYVQKDLQLDGLKSEAALSGTYTGYASSDMKSEGSSAILVNGRESSLDLSGLESFSVNGHAYVGTATYKDAGDPDENQNGADILMGQSIAVKSNQLVYLIPPEALGCEIRNDGTIGESVFKSNPLRMEDYQMLLNNPAYYQMVDAQRPIAALNGKCLADYMPGSGNGTIYWPEVIFKKTNSGTLVYCYMRFEDAEKANQYFADYYGVNKETVDRYTGFYVDAIKMAQPEDMLYLNLAGNALTYNGSAGSLVSATGTKADAEESEKNMDNTFRALTTKLVASIDQLTVTEHGKSVFENIIEEDKLRTILTEQGIVELVLSTEPTTSGDTYHVVLTSGDYVINGADPDVRVVIALGDVTVQKDFTGLILCKGSVLITNSGGDLLTELNSLTLEQFSNALMAKDSEGKIYALDFFLDGVNYANSGNKLMDYGTETVSLADLVVYEHWSKK